jgi:hypothetical protein
VDCDDTDPRRRCGAPCLWRVRWNVWLADQRTVLAADSSLHRGSSLRMKRDAVLLPLSTVNRKDQARGWEPRGSSFSLGFQQIPDFRKQLLFSRRTNRRRWRRLLEAIDLLDHQEQAKSNNQKFDHRLYKHSIGKNRDSFVGSLLQRRYLLAIQNNEQVGKIDLPKDQARIGIKMLLTKEDTILPNAAPMMTPMARSITLPLNANSLNSSIIDMVSFWFCVFSCEFSSNLVSRPRDSRYFVATPGETDHQLRFSAAWVLGFLASRRRCRATNFPN